MSELILTGNRPTIAWSGQGLTHHLSIFGNVGSLLTEDVTKRTIRVSMRDLGGAAAAGYKIIVQLSKSGISKHGFIISRTPKVYFTDNEGNADMLLWENKDGLRNSVYLVTIIDNNTGHRVLENGRFVVMGKDENLVNILEY